MRQSRRLYLARVAAARQLSALQRGRVVRKEISRMHTGARVFQAAWRRYVRRQLASLRGLAAVMMQSWARGWVARRRCGCTSAWMSAWVSAWVSAWCPPFGQGVCKLATRSVVETHKAALSEAIRSFGVVIRFRRQRESVTRIAAWRRGVLARRHFRSIRSAAVLIQRWIRRRWHVRSFRKRLAAAVVVESAWRRHDARRRYARMSL